MDKNNKKEKKDIFWLYLFGVFAIISALNMVFVGEVGSKTGASVHTFEGLEKLFAIIPFLVGVFFIWGANIKRKLLKEKEENKD